MVAIRELVASSRPGDRLPSSRQLRVRFGVGPVTVRRAVAQLVAEGVVTTVPGVGTFVSRRRPPAPADTDWQRVALGASPVDPAGMDRAHRIRTTDGVLSLASGYLDASARHDQRLAAALARAARRPGAWEPPPMFGIPELRTWFAHEAGVEPDDILITPGVQAALSATMRAILPAGSPILFAVPTYPGALAVARSAGLIPVPIPADADGVRPELLARGFETTGARLVYLQPTFANPDGRVLAASRRGEVLAAATDAGAFIVEDDWARWLSHRPAAPPPLIRDDPHGHVISLTSLTKTTAPSFRIGAIAARGPALERLAVMRIVDDFYMPRPLQEAALELVSSSHWAGHLRQVTLTLKTRLEVLLAALSRHLGNPGYVRPQGGPSLWLRLPRGTDDTVVAERALSAGVAVLPGSLFTIGETGHPHLRLAFGGIGSDAIDEAIRRLAKFISP